MSGRRIYLSEPVFLTFAICALTLTVSASSVRPALMFVGAVFDGVDGVDGLDEAESVVVSPDGKHVYVAGYKDAAVAVFSRNPNTGVLAFVEVKKDGVGGVDGLAGAKSVTVSPDGKHVYAAGWLDYAVTVFSRNSTTGALTFGGMVVDSVGGVDGLYGVASVMVSPDGKHLYAAGENDDAIAVFARNPTTGALTFVEVMRNGVGGVDGLNGANSVTLSPDGKHVYVAGVWDDAVAVFARNSTSGALTYGGTVKDGVGGVDGLNGPRSVTMSPDGNHVYATAYDDNAVSMFTRNSTSGMLTYGGIVKDGVGGVDGLFGAFSVTVSPDGSHVCAAGFNDHAVALFARDSTTGALTFEGVAKAGVDGVDGLGGAYSVTMSPEGNHVYAAGYWDDAVVALRISHLGLYKADLPETGSTSVPVFVDH